MSNAIQAFDKAYDHLQVDDDTWFKYESERRSREAYLTGMLTAKEQGFAEGMEKGIEKGIALMVKNLKEKNVPIELISEYTGLSIDKIK